MSPTLVVLIGGGTGVGKSTVANELALALDRDSSPRAHAKFELHVVPSLNDRDALVQRLERRGDESARPAPGMERVAG